MLEDPAVQRLALTAAYGACAFLAGFAGWRCIGIARRAWWAVALSLAMLTFAKDIRMNDRMSGAGRSVVKSLGWYGEHRLVQAILACLLAAALLATFGAVRRRLQNLTPGARAAALVLMLLVAFLILRALSIHWIDKWTTYVIGGMKFGWWIELVAVVLIAFAAIRDIRHPQAQRSES